MTYQRSDVAIVGGSDERFEKTSLPATRVVVLDEVQRVPALLNEVHRAIEGTRRRFVLLGSSARRLKTADTPTPYPRTMRTE